MNKLLTFCSIAEGATGAALIAAPSLVGQWLLGAALSGVAVVIGRVTGISLVALAVACWPGMHALCGMLTYSALVTGYLAWIGIGGQWVGPLLWPAVAVHAVPTLLLAWEWTQQSR